MKFSTVVYMSFVCLMCSIKGANSCRCRIPYPQEAICNYDYAIKGKVSKIQFYEQAPNRRIKYTIDVQERFKGSFRPYSKVVIDAYENGATCGVILKKDGVYLLTGRGKSISSCNWLSEWTSLTDFQKNALRNGVYSGTCNSGCTIVRANNSNVNECFIDESNSTLYECLISKAVCRRTSNGECTWSNCV